MRAKTLFAFAIIKFVLAAPYGLFFIEDLIKMATSKFSYNVFKAMDHKICITIKAIKYNYSFRKCLFCKNEKKGILLLSRHSIFHEDCLRNFVNNTKFTSKLLCLFGIVSSHENAEKITIYLSEFFGNISFTPEIQVLKIFHKPSSQTNVYKSSFAVFFFDENGLPEIIKVEKNKKIQNLDPNNILHNFSKQRSEKHSRYAKCENLVLLNKALFYKNSQYKITHKYLPEYNKSVQYLLDLPFQILDNRFLIKIEGDHYEITIKIVDFLDEESQYYTCFLVYFTNPNSYINQKMLTNVIFPKPGIVFIDSNILLDVASDAGGQRIFWQPMNFSKINNTAIGVLKIPRGNIKEKS